MAHNEHVKMLRRSVFAWNDWRKQQLEVYLDLSEADLFRADLSGARLSGGCMNDSAGKFCPDIMPPRVIANVQKETEDAWAEVRAQAVCVAASDGCEPS